MISVNDFVNTAIIPYREGGGYIWGATGGTWTAEDQKKATREMTVKYGSRWIGKRVWDCSGLIYWIYRLYGMTITHGSNTMYKEFCSAKGKIKGGKKENGDPIKKGSAVFLYRSSDNNRHHVGVYIGDGQCVEAKGTINGVVMSDISHWHEWGELLGVDYSDETVVMDMAESIRPGSKGEAVRQLQKDLNKIGYNCGTVDGIYGTKTLAAVREFQTYYGLTVDGIAGEKTLCKINELVGRQEEPQPSTDVEELFSRVESALAELRKAVIANA